MSVKAGNNYEKLHQQFMCCYPLDKLDWASILPPPIDLIAQKEIIDATCGHALNRRYPVRQTYQTAFVKRLLHILKDHEEIHDDVYNSLCGGDLAKSTTGSTSYAYKHYVLPVPYKSFITMRESNSFVSEGTTGLCTWEAALALTDYLLQNPNYLCGKNILELGAGAGLCGIALNHCAPDIGEILITDGSEPCVVLMRENIALNCKPPPTSLHHHPTTVTTASPQCALLHWNEVANFPWKNYASPDLILAADVIYDDTQFKPLLDCMDFIFNMRGNQNIEMLLASTVRNADTLTKFQNQLGNRQYDVEMCKNISPSSSWFCRDATAIINIMRLRRLNK